VRGLSGKAVLMAGGAGGIGSATSVRLAEEGALVAVGDLNQAAAEEVAARIEKAGGEAFAIGLDISDEESVVSAVQATVKAFGGLDSVHINAADLSPETILNDTDVVDIELEVFDRTLRTGLRGHVLCTRHALPELLQRGGGALVYTSSAAAFVGEPERPSYAVAKSGINAIVRHVASKWGKQGIRANAIAPGLVLTETVQEALDPSFVTSVLKRQRSNRLGRPDDIAAMAAFLMSSDAEWVNGQVISVDGGTTMR
jgi:NAD(P)-dependent dehydrogenase (short-subunit alcohol dehydrogenase family)